MASAEKVPSKWATMEQLQAVAQTLTASDVVELLRFADTVDALLIDETRAVASGFSVRDARHNLVRGTSALETLRDVVLGRADLPEPTELDVLQVGAMSAADEIHRHSFGAPIADLRFSLERVMDYVRGMESTLRASRG